MSSSQDESKPPAEKKDKKESSRAFRREFPAWAQMLALIGGIISFSVTEWDKKRIDDEAAKTQVSDMSRAAFAMVDTYNSPEFIRIRKTIAQTWFSRHPNQNLCDDDYVMTSDAQDAVAFVDFFDKVQFCIDQKMCDQTAIDSTLAPNAAAFSPILSTLIRNYRKVFHANDFGIGFQKLTKTYLIQSKDAFSIEQIRHGTYTPHDLCKTPE